MTYLHYITSREEPPPKCSVSRLRSGNEFQLLVWGRVAKRDTIEHLTGNEFLYLVWDESWNAGIADWERVSKVGLGTSCKMQQIGIPDWERVHKSYIWLGMSLKDLMGYPWTTKVWMKIHFYNMWPIGKGTIPRKKWKSSCWYQCMDSARRALLWHVILFQNSIPKMCNTIFSMRSYAVLGHAILLSSING